MCFPMNEVLALRQSLKITNPIRHATRVENFVHPLYHAGESMDVDAKLYGSFLSDNQGVFYV